MADDWIWDGGRPSVDFLNTLRDRLLGGRETLHTPADLARWLRTAQLTDSPGKTHTPTTADTPSAAGASHEADGADLDAALKLRGAIDAVAFAVREGRPPPAPAVELINQTAAATPLVPRLVIVNGRLATEADRSTRAALARLAMDAVDFLASDEIVRLRVCAADDCGMRFIDRSPASNRQWCSMRRCGNRSKARRHYARKT